MLLAMKPSFQFHIVSKRVSTSQCSVFFFPVIKVKQAVELINYLCWVKTKY